MPAEWAISVAIPISKRTGDITNSVMHRGVKLLENAMEIIVKVLEKSCKDR